MLLPVFAFCLARHAKYGQGEKPPDRISSSQEGAVQAALKRANPSLFSFQFSFLLGVQNKKAQMRANATKALAVLLCLYAVCPVKTVHVNRGLGATCTLFPHPSSQPFTAGAMVPTAS